MKLIDITNSHSQLVNEQLANTDAYFIKVYSLGQTTVFYADAATHRDIVILNRKRRIKDVEIEGPPLVHHMIPLLEEDILEWREDIILNPDLLITTSYNTHNIIHYGFSRVQSMNYVERSPGDTKLW